MRLVLSTVMALCVAVSAALAASTPVPETPRKPCAEYDSLVLYVSFVTGWPIGDVCPRVIYTSAHDMAVGPRLGPAMEMETGATFYPTSGAIKLSVQTDLSAVEGMALLIHQLVHAFQYDLGLDADVRCPRMLEREAYRVQAQFLSDNGYEAEADIAARMSQYRATCHDDWMHRD